MFALNDFAVRFYQDRLSRSREAQEYLAKRGILKQTQEQWDLGFAPPDWEALTFALEKQRMDIGLAARLGLIKTRQPGGGHYDTFRNRLMFPIHDVQGRVIAFGGRAMGDDPAKYLNSEQSPLFDKSRTLYGLTFARRKLSTDTPAVFVEGYVDVITTHQAGFTQCVATLGTSMTEEHARMLVRYSPRVIICYDADSAGIKATLRGATVWESIGVEGAEVRVARLPAGEDPDSLLRSGDTAGFQAALDNAVPRMDFQIEQAMERHDIQTDDGRQQALAEIVPIIASIATMTQRDRYIQKIAHLHPAYRFNLSRAIELAARRHRYVPAAVAERPIAARPRLSAHRADQSRAAGKRSPACLYSALPIPSAGESGSRIHRISYAAANPQDAKVRAAGLRERAATGRAAETDKIAAGNTAAANHAIPCVTTVRRR